MPQSVILMGVYSLLSTSPALFFKSLNYRCFGTKVISLLVMGWEMFGGFERYLRFLLSTKLELQIPVSSPWGNQQNQEESFAGLEYQIQRCADCFSGHQKSPWSWKTWGKELNRHMQDGESWSESIFTTNLLSFLPSLLHLVLKGLFSIPLTFSLISAPAPRLVIYVIFPNGKIIADSAILSVSMCFRNKVGFVSEAWINVWECRCLLQWRDWGIHDMCSSVWLMMCGMPTHEHVNGEVCCDASTCGALWGLLQCLRKKENCCLSP